MSLLHLLFVTIFFSDNINQNQVLKETDLQIILSHNVKSIKKIELCLIQNTTNKHILMLS